MDSLGGPSYLPEYVHVAGRQVLESLDILATSRVLETIKSRYQFLSEQTDPSGFQRPLATLRALSVHPRYAFDIQQAIEGYHRMYYDRVIPEYAISALNNPVGFNLTQLYCLSLVRASADIVKDQIEEISRLKRISAVEKRKGKLIEVLDQVMLELTEKCSTAASYVQAKEAIEKAMGFARSSLSSAQQ